MRLSATTILLSLIVLGACKAESNDVPVDAAAAIDAASDVDAVEAGPLTLRVMSYNLRWGGFDDGANNWAFRRDLAYQVFRDFDADSAGLQEPTTEQVADVVENVPNLDSYEFDQRTQQIVWRADRFELEDAGGFLLFEGNELSGSIRFCTWVHLVEATTGRGYYHYNVHLDHRQPASGQLSVVRLVEGIAARTTSDPFVITGDFNASESSPTMAFMRGEQMLPDELGNPVANPLPVVDTFRVLHPDQTDVGTAGGFGGSRTGNKIDYVLVEPSVTTHEASIVYTNDNGVYPSDHFPVTAVFTFPD